MKNLMIVFVASLFVSSAFAMHPSLHHKRKFSKRSTVIKGLPALKVFRALGVKPRVRKSQRGLVSVKRVGPLTCKLIKAKNKKGAVCLLRGQKRVFKKRVIRKKMSKKRPSKRVQIKKRIVIKG